MYLNQNRIGECYSGVSADGKLILTPAFAAAIARDSRARGEAVPDICGARSRACDAAPTMSFREQIIAMRARMAARAQARALDEKAAESRPNYSVLQRACDTQRLGSAGYQTWFGTSPTPVTRAQDASARSLERDRYRANNSMRLASDDQVDRYIELQQYYDAMRAEAGDA